MISRGGGGGEGLIVAIFLLAIYEWELVCLCRIVFLLFLPMKVVGNHVQPSLTFES